jgi:hypothetical protein
MATNKRDLKAYARFDGTGRIVPGSLVLRRTKPKVGTWIEVQAYECCDTFECIVPSVTLSTTATGFPINTSGCSPYVLFKCNDSIIWQISDIPLSAPPPAISVQDYVDALNSSYSWVGIWTLDGTTVTLEMNGNIANALCPTGELTMISDSGCPG